MSGQKQLEAAAKVKSVSEDTFLQAGKEIPSSGRVLADLERRHNRKLLLTRQQLEASGKQVRVSGLFLGLAETQTLGVAHPAEITAASSTDLCAQTLNRQNAAGYRRFTPSATTILYTATEQLNLKSRPTAPRHPTSPEVQDLLSLSHTVKQLCALGTQKACPASRPRSGEMGSSIPATLVRMNAIEDGWMEESSSRIILGWFPTYK
ncbi:uncharacterized protein LOC129181107 [Dunckerocampus dactyliophorus]|uniref:uncharacterized protein LOC129181107 n=1 Tax=Dunckerocampus dactyliophorus TaxID=161453 RepID=UPI002405D26A|nr:uncharacterized protein LOC129181107 [Dunckerocampus dactyliophorus]